MLDAAQFEWVFSFFDLLTFLVGIQISKLFSNRRPLRFFPRIHADIAAVPSIQQAPKYNTKAGTKEWINRQLDPKALPANYRISRRAFLMSIDLRLALIQ